MLGRGRRSGSPAAGQLYGVGVLGGSGEQLEGSSHGVSDGTSLLSSWTSLAGRMQCYWSLILSSLSCLKGMASGH